MNDDISILGALQRDAAGPPSCALEPRDDAVQRIKQSTLQKNYCEYPEVNVLLLEFPSSE